jgi:hypothetical protein
LLVVAAGGGTWNEDVATTRSWDEPRELRKGMLADIFYEAIYFI